MPSSKKRVPQHPYALAGVMRLQDWPCCCECNSDDPHDVTHVLDASRSLWTVLSRGPHLIFAGQSIAM